MIFSLRKGVFLAALARHHPLRTLPCLVLLPRAGRHLLAAALAAQLQLQGTVVPHVSFHLETREERYKHRTIKVRIAETSTPTCVCGAVGLKLFSGGVITVNGGANRTQVGIILVTSRSCALSPCAKDGFVCIPLPPRAAPRNSRGDRGRPASGTRSRGDAAGLPFG